MSFTPREKAFCVISYAQQGSPSVVQRQFRTRYGRRATRPSRGSILRRFDEYQERGPSERKNKVGTRWVQTELKEADVMEAFRQNPHETNRELALRENLPSRFSILKMLKEAKFHRYKMQHRQEISEANRLARGACHQSARYFRCLGQVL